MTLKAMARGWQVALLALGLSVLSAPVLRAQTDTTVSTRTTHYDDDKDFPWGLLGLLGLAGLAGLRPKRREDVHVHETYTTTPPRDPMPPRDRVDPTPPPPRV
ncbi:MAG TPA: WGxxGxxG family protein [Longimicrobiaceae bacterium]